MTRGVILLICLFGLLLFLPPPVRTQEVQKKVLIFSSDDQFLPSLVLVNKAIRTTMKEGSPFYIQFFYESQDSFRIPNDRYEQELVALLRRKYEGEKFDLIYVLAPPALRFLLKHESELFSATPIVYIVTDQRRLMDLKMGANVTGVSGRAELKPTLDVALSLQPETQRVVVVAGTATSDTALVQVAHEEFREYEGKPEFTYLVGLPISELKNKLAELPPRSIIFYLSVSSENATKIFTNPEILAQLTPSANAPIYAASQVHMGNGIVGGRLIDFEALGTRAAETGLRILAGESPQNIPAQTMPSTTMFDWRQLRRWGIDETRLPAGSVVQFRELTFWELYKWRVVVAVSLIILQALLIVGLLINRARRRRAEENLRLSESRFRIMADSAPVMIWIAGPDKLSSYFNQGWLTFTGRTLEQELGLGWTEAVYRDDYTRCLDTYESAFERREPFTMEYRLHRADGEFRWVYGIGTPRFSSDGEFQGYIGSCIDISDRKEAEEALQLAHQEVNKLKNQLEAENVYLKEAIKLAHNVDEIIGDSDEIKYVLFKIEQVGQTDSTVLILGETGTGKELVARAIHNQSLRKDRPLVKVNCAALSASLIESELFGHEKGSFTGASARKIGRFELADGATIFLDEIGELPLELQAKLLRIVQEGEFERLGSTRTIKVNVRILAATNRNLKAEVEKGTFRDDLWYRLNVFPITVPPLRQRREDVPKLVEHFVRMLSKKVGKKINAISSATTKKLQSYSWPGNVRELANVIERAVINSQGPVLLIADQFDPATEELTTSTRTLEEVEREYIIRILDETSWRIEGPNGAAKRLGLNPSTLRTRMSKLGIQKNARAVAGNPIST